MTLDEVIQVADKAYDSMDEAIIQAVETNESNGDTLALFVARELKDVFDTSVSPEKNVREMTRAMDSAIRQLEAVRSALEDMA